MISFKNLDKSNDYLYLSKFGCEIGQCDTYVKAKFRHPIVMENNEKFDFMI